jgi:hypothetical protein
MLLPAEKQGMIAYINADMLGSPNGIRGVYDEAEAATGSTAIRDLFARISTLPGSPGKALTSGRI